jgi:hypothetical protein
MLRPNFAEILAATIIVLGSVAFHLLHSHVSAKALADQASEVRQLKGDLERQRATFDSELEVIRIQSDADIRNLEAQIHALKKK